MALINTLRNKMGKFVVIVIAIAILSFVAADMLGPNSSLLGGPDNNVGEVAGSSIKFEEFQGAIDDRKASFIMYTGQRPGTMQEPMLREQAWELLVSNYAYQKQYDALGVAVPADEEWDMAQGRNIDPTIQALFRDQNGQFDRSQLITFLQNKSDAPQQSQDMWNMVTKDMVIGRQRIKYESMLVKGNFITQAEAERSYHDQNDVAEVKYLYIPFTTVPSDQVEVSDADVQAFYNDNPLLFETEATRSLNYVSFPIIPSATDSAVIKEDIESLVTGLIQSEEDSLFATSQSDGRDAYGTYASATLPPALQVKEDSLEVGQVYGPLLGFDGYQLFKVTKVHEDTALYDLAKISREIYASEDTRNIAARKADLFAANAKDQDSFNALAKEEGLTVLPSGALGQNDQRILGLGDARRLVQWLYRDASVGDVSEDEEINEQYVIAIMTSEVDKGTTPLTDQVKTDIRLRLEKEKKGALILSKLTSTDGSLEEVAAAYGNDASIYQSSDLRMDANILPNVGFDPVAVGIAFSLATGERSAPFVGENGVMIVEMQNLTESPEIADYAAFKQQLLQGKQIRTSQNVADAIKDDADIVDERYKFY